MYGGCLDGYEPGGMMSIAFLAVFVIVVAVCAAIRIGG